MHTFGAMQGANQAERDGLVRLHSKGLAEPIPGAAVVYRLTDDGRRWIDRARGADLPQGDEDPIMSDRRKLERGLGIADDKAA
jgi:DNA-binding PadR family transcriptional regulator